MARLTKYTLQFDERRDKWVLGNDQTDKPIKMFATKDQATRGGALKKVLGAEGGSVKIQKKNGKFQEERTFPRKDDPRRSKG